MWSRRALVISSQCSRRSTTSVTNLTAPAKVSARFSETLQQQQQQQHFSTKSKKASASAPAPVSYFERKKARKESKKLAYQQKLGKRQQDLHRRDNAPKDVLKSKFDEWWKPRKTWQEIMERKARQQNKEWKIQVAAIVERLPVILPDKTEWESDFEELKAYLGQFGKEYPKELFPDQSLAGDKKTEPVPITDEDLFGFRPAPRETEADHSGNIHTMDRKLKDRIFFVVKNQNDWIFPTVELKEGESLLQAAQRAIEGNNLTLYCASNAPMAVDMDVFSDENGDASTSSSSPYFGTKTFFLRLQYDDGNGPTAGGSNYAWLDREEFVQHVQEQKGDGASKFYHYML